MKKRTSTIVTLLLVLTAASSSAQQMAMRDRPPEVDVLSRAVEAISTMHMEEFTDSALWTAAIDAMKASLSEEYRTLFERHDGESWEEVVEKAVARIEEMDPAPVPDSVYWEAAVDGLIDALNDP